MATTGDKHGKDEGEEEVELLEGDGLELDDDGVDVDEADGDNLDGELDEAEGDGDGIELDDNDDADADADADESGSAVDGLEGDLAAWDEVEREYGVFQREPVEFIYYHFVYMGRRKPPPAVGFDVREVKTEVLEFAEGKTALESSVLMSLIKNNEVHRRRRYKVHKMLRYNVTADIQRVEAVVKGGDAALDVAPYFKTFECYTDVPFDDGMVELDGHNALYIFMAEDAPLRGAHARRSRGRQRGAAANNTGNTGNGGRPFRRTRHAPTPAVAP